MMRDIVEQLRWEDSSRVVKSIATEAADEIERLTTALERIRWLEGINPTAYKIAIDALSLPTQRKEIR